MRIMKKTIFIFLTTIITLGCKKSFLDINQNPNEPTVVTPNVVLSAALAGSATNQGTNYLKVNNLMGYWSRSGNYVPDAQTEQYNIPNDYTNTEWGRMYNTLNRYEYIEKQGHQNNLPFYVGVAKAMKAFHFSQLVDIYNDVPYTEAFDVAGKVQPKYDKGQDIYNDLVKQLDSAVIYFDSAKTVYDASTELASVIASDDQYDIMFGKGKAAAPDDRMDNWVKFSNTLKLRLLLHEYKVIDAGYRTTEVQKITDNGRGFLNAGESATVNPVYALSSDQISPFVSNFKGVTAAPVAVSYYRANNYAIDFYISTGDERQISFYTVLSGVTVGGNFEGDPNSVPNTFTSAIGGTYGGTVKDATQDQLILPDFESLFIQAEATQRGWLAGDDSALYASAVTQNFVYLDPNGDVAVDASDAAAYLNGDGLLGAPTDLADVNWDAATDKLKLIMTQKWAALNGIDWLEAWTDYRRTGFPSSDILGTSHAPTHIQNKIPVRYPYPQTELNTNVNTPKLTVTDLFTSPPFWAQ